MSLFSSLTVRLLPPNAEVHEYSAVAANHKTSAASDLFPLKLSSILNRPWKTNRDVADLLQRFETSSLGMMDPIRLVKNAIPEDMPLKVTEINPRLKDGGAFVKFEHAASLDPAEVERECFSLLYMCLVDPKIHADPGIPTRNDDQQAGPKTSQAMVQSFSRHQSTTCSRNALARRPIQISYQLCQG
jgi:hypothetical protein